MSVIRENYSLRELNTFGIDCTSKYFISIGDPDELISFFSNFPFGDLPFLILGGGSNILFTGDFAGVIIQPDISGIEILEESDTHVRIRVGASEEWDNFVGYCVNSGFGGIENLSLIPGRVGAAPIQNIGAYGVEVSECIERVSTIMLDDLLYKEMENRECLFGYRDSIFKRQRGKYLITHVLFKLTKQSIFRTNYGNMNQELEKYPSINLATIRDAVIGIRSRKLPDPATTGNAGSFFKNPALDIKDVSELKKEYPKIPVYPFNAKQEKVAAAWLIDKCGWKGKWVGNAGVHKYQPLVLVSNGKACGQEILELSLMIQKSVFDKFGIMLEPEVNIV